MEHGQRELALTQQLVGAESIVKDFAIWAQTARNPQDRAYYLRLAQEYRGKAAALKRLLREARDS